MMCSYYIAEESLAIFYSFLLYACENSAEGVRVNQVCHDPDFDLAEGCHQVV